MWAALVTVVLVVHFGFVAFVLLGGFLAWRWPHAIWFHLPAIVWALLIVFNQVDCPLTWLEGKLRERAGQAPLTQGFVDRYLTGVIYPPQYLQEARAAVALVVLGSWIGAYALWRRRRRVVATPTRPR